MADEEEVGIDGIKKCSNQYRVGDALDEVERDLSLKEEKLLKAKELILKELQVLKAEEVTLQRLLHARIEQPSAHVPGSRRPEAPPPGDTSSGDPASPGGALPQLNLNLSGARQGQQQYMGNYGKREKVVARVM